MTPDKYLNWDTTLSSVVKILDKNHVELKKFVGEQKIILLRDWKGRIHIGFPSSREKFSSGDFLELLDQIHIELGPLSPAYTKTAEPPLEKDYLIDGISFFLEDLFDPSDFWGSPYLVSINNDSRLPLFLLDRQEKENDWLRAESKPNNLSTIPRAVFFGIKGGVGRSSALTALALHLANQGKRVLIIDADFESPGVSSSLLSQTARPDFGLVDWFAAESLGCDGLEELAEQRIAETSPLSERTNGKIIIAPSHGLKTEAYVGKLGRIYRTTEEGTGFAERLNRIVDLLEQVHSADVTLFDSRAGIDDTAAAAISQLAARVSFLFAVNTQQTWDAYALLFKHLQRHPTARTENDFRFKLRFISALTPEEVGSTKGYFADFREAAYTTCAENLYDKDSSEISLDTSKNLNLFNPAFDDEDTPHYPSRIVWDEVLRAFDPIKEPGQLATAVIAKSFGDFLDRAAKLLE
ncbi:ArsA-related P-loop ATPase [Acidovorax sp. SUPP3334]|uniref:KGGVGR-motif variant AAA ATPase n=1 Tax=Acidovorax sp. SUPP3334 TaxID=2920881 RepID=UPI0023DE58F7|nr:ArsA-related P-loop ATPase [Acidovorax sp. SUPP3334]GKT22433.1 hypothetical protein AVHM3334_08425 [Acidovorax sp. SUPP3334]